MKVSTIIHAINLRFILLVIIRTKITVQSLARKNRQNIVITWLRNHFCRYFFIYLNKNIVSLQPFGNLQNGCPPATSRFEIDLSCSDNKS